MRIIAGRHRGRTLRSPRKQGVRPTADRVREAIFNILGHNPDWTGFEDATVLDVFAGSGACGLEALSRGARFATFIDHDPDVLLAIRRNAADCGEARSIALLRLDATRLPPTPRTAGTPCSLAFLDPPYGSGLAVAALQGIGARRWIGAGALAVVEVGEREPLTPPPSWAITDDRVYGAARVVFLRFDPPSVAPTRS